MAVTPHPRPLSIKWKGEKNVGAYLIGVPKRVNLKVHPYEEQIG